MGSSIVLLKLALDLVLALILYITSVSEVLKHGPTGPGLITSTAKNNLSLLSIENEIL